MPKGTRVDRCFQKLKGKKGESSAAAICQKSTGQSLATGKSTRKSDKKPVGSPHGKKTKSESLGEKLDAMLLSDSASARQYRPTRDFAARLTVALHEVFDASQQ